MGNKSDEPRPTPTWTYTNKPGWTDKDNAGKRSASAKLVGAKPSRAERAAARRGNRRFFFSRRNWDDDRRRFGPATSTVLTLADKPPTPSSIPSTPCEEDRFLKNKQAVASPSSRVAVRRGASTPPRRRQNVALRDGGRRPAATTSRARRRRDDPTGACEHARDFTRSAPASRGRSPMPRGVSPDAPGRAASARRRPRTSRRRPAKFCTASATSFVANIFSCRPTSTSRTRSSVPCQKVRNTTPLTQTNLGQGWLERERTPSRGRR